MFQDQNRHEIPEPNPGSPDAVEMGCRCPVMDNAYGRGTPMGFWINDDCSLHGSESLRCDNPDLYEVLAVSLIITAVVLCAVVSAVVLL